ncbi:nitroreductase family protein [Rhodococcus ruber]|uniref:Nitroreductase family protein n=1 Tax=Rhodococcus ruber TaxID=1830 RepID=A0ABT4MEN4_9NOCA|nr:nitroreductase family protein [Rhodococcus ruber]MCZ4519437.1 nitroreductase family protein [Rhodococcus ruber]
MNIYEALYTTRMMRRLRPDPIPLETQCRILDAAIRAPTGGNTQRWHFLAVDDPAMKQALSKLYQQCRKLEYADMAAGKLAKSMHNQEEHAATLGKIKASGDYFTEHFAEIPLLLFVFSIDDHGGANIYPAIWSALLAARAEGVGGTITTVLRYEAEAVAELLGVPVGENWKMNTMLAFGYPLGRWGVAANRHPIHEVSSRNQWGRSIGATIPEPMWSYAPDAGPVV